jgi:hypothetical protein
MVVFVLRTMLVVRFREEEATMGLFEPTRHLSNRRVSHERMIWWIERNR